MNKDAIIEKLISGRFLFTLATGYVFIWATVNRLLPPEVIVGIVTLVIKEYFTRPDRGKNGGNNA